MSLFGKSGFFRWFDGELGWSWGPLCQLEAEEQEGEEGCGDEDT